MTNFKPPTTLHNMNEPLPRRSNLARRINEGLRGKLEFEYACNRGHIFSEIYMHSALMEIVASNINHNTNILLPGFAPDELNDQHTSGRRREIDFAGFRRTSGPENNGEMIFAAEAKWADSNHATFENIYKDICRLAIVSEKNPTATCLFILAGSTTQVEKLLPKNEHYTSKSILLGGTHERTIYVTGPKYPKKGQSLVNKDYRPALEKELPYLPESFSICPFKTGTLEDGPKWQVRTWGIRRFHNRNPHQPDHH